MTRTAPLLEALVQRKHDITAYVPAELRSIAAERPDLAGEAIDTLGLLLELPHEDLYSRDTESDRSALLDPNPSVTFPQTYDDGRNHREGAAWALSRLARTYPDDVARTFDDLLGLTESSRQPSREYGLHAIGRVAAVTPADTERGIQTILPWLGADAPGVRALAANAIAEIAIENATAVAPARAVPDLIPSLVSAADATRLTAAKALALLTAAEADSIDPLDRSVSESAAVQAYPEVCAWAIDEATARVSLDPRIPECENFDDIVTGHGVIDALVEAFVEMADEDDPTVRIGAAVGLLHIGLAVDEPRDEVYSRLDALGSDQHAQVADTTTQLIEGGRFEANWPDPEPSSPYKRHGVTVSAFPNSESEPLGNCVRMGPAGRDITLEGYNTYGSMAAVEIQDRDGSTLAKLADIHDNTVGIELGPFLGRETGARFDEDITVKPTNLAIAQSVTVRLPGDARFTYATPPAEALDEQLVGQPVEAGDVVPLRVNVDASDDVESADPGAVETIPIRIAATYPDRPVRITEHTAVRIADEPESFDDWWGTTEAAVDATVSFEQATREKRRDGNRGEHDN